MNISTKNSMRAAALGALIPAMLCLAPLPAQAASFTFAGQVGNGTDPMGVNYAAGPWGGGITNFEEGAGQQNDPTEQPAFAPAALGLKDATSFSLTVTGSAETLLPLSAGWGNYFDVWSAAGNYLYSWDATENSAGTSITFTAPTGEALLAGQRFDTDITFRNNLPSGFTYDITWTGDPAAVPEPATWAMLLLGFFGLGSMLRSRRKQGSMLAA
jgi:hypothetical protein